MKPLIFYVIAMLGSGPLFAAGNSPACLAKRAEIERSIAAAEMRGNAQEVRGLRKALRANSAHCTTAALEAEREREIAKAAAKVAERRAELEKAERKGDARKTCRRASGTDRSRTASAALTGAIAAKYGRPVA